MSKKEKKEKVVKEEKEKKNNKIKLDKKKKIIILVSVIALLAIIGITLFLVLRKDNKEYVLAEVEPTISTLEDGSYYIFGSPKNQSFEVEVSEDFTYKVVDEDNNEVEVLTTEKDGKVVINAPKDLYKEGKIYTLTIENGTFTEEDMKEAKTVLFSIVRKSKQTAELNEDVKTVSSEKNKVEEKEDELVLTSKEKYEIGDIVLIDNEKAYKVESKEDGTYQLTTPTITEVFDEIDYYGSMYLDLSDFEENEEIEEYLVAYAEENLIDKLIPTVYAAPKISVNSEWNKKRDALVATIHMETDPGDKVFKKSFLKHHKLSFDYEVELKIKLDYDIDDDYVDVNLTLQVTNTPSVKLETQSETLDKIKDGLKAYTAGENALALLKSDYDSVKKDTKNLKQTVGTVPIPMPPALWFISAEVDFGLIMEFDVKANMEAKLTNTNKVTIGVNSENGIYGKTKYTNKINASAFGEASMRLGSQMDLEVDLLGMVEVSGGVKGGIYGSATLDMKSEITSDKVYANLLATTKAGLFSTIVAEAKVITEKYETTIFDKELELYSYELPLEASSEKTETVAKEEETPKQETNNNSSSNNTKPEEKYYTVTIYPYAFCSDCNQETGLCTPSVVNVKAGDKLGNYKDKWGYPIGEWENYTLYNTFVVKQKELDELSQRCENDWKTCENACNEQYDSRTDFDSWYACHNACDDTVTCDYLDTFVEWPAEVTKNTIINQDYTLVFQSGCGSAE